MTGPGPRHGVPPTGGGHRFPLGRPGPAAGEVGSAAAGSAFVVAGGLVAAVNSAAPFEHGSWLAAYLVLVGGVAQVVLGAAPQLLGLPVASAGLRRLRLASWNVGNAAVITGVLAAWAGLVVAGSVPLLAVLVSCAAGARPAWRTARGRVLLYEGFVVFLAVSIGIGCVLAGVDAAEARASCPGRL